MKHSISTCLGLALLATPALAQSTVCEDFEGGMNPGWTAGPFGAPVTYEAAGGNPTGHLNAIDSGNNPEWYSPTGGVYSSDYRGTGVNSISVDLKEESGPQFLVWILLIHDPDPMVSGDESYAFTMNDVAADSPPSGGGWVTYDFAIPSSMTTSPPVGIGIGFWNYFGMSVSGTSDDKWNFFMTGGTTRIAFHIANNPILGFDLLGTPWNYGIDNVCYTMDLVPEILCNGDGGDQMGCTDCPCANNSAPGTPGGCLNSAGTSTLLLASGDPSVSLPSGSTTDLQFEAEGAPPSSTNVLLSGNGVAPNNMANPCFGLGSGALAADRDGLRCAVQSVVRHGNRSANAMGEIKDAAGPNRVWGGPAQPTVGIAVQGGFAAGQTRYFQITHRDDAMAVCMRGLNTSQAVGITFTP